MSERGLFRVAEAIDSLAVAIATHHVPGPSEYTLGGPLKNDPESKPAAVKGSKKKAQPKTKDIVEVTDPQPEPEPEPMRDATEADVRGLAKEAMAKGRKTREEIKNKITEIGAISIADLDSTGLNALHQWLTAK